MARDCLEFIEENTCAKLNSPFEWVSVEDRLPDLGRWVLAALKFLPEDRYATPIIVQFQNGEWRSNKGGYIPITGFEFIKITHWSLLPKNPEVKK